MATSSVAGRLHRYLPQSNLTLFEHLPSSRHAMDGNVVQPNTVIFIGGLYDSFLSVPYVPLLASYINQCPGWSVMEIQLSSSGLGWGVCDLHLDVEEIGSAVNFLRDRVRSSCLDTPTDAVDGKIVLMGHSTGSQDVLHYLYHSSEHERPPVDGAILQAPVSDREGLKVMRERDGNMEHAYKECLRIARDARTIGPQGAIQTLPPELTSILGWTTGLISCQRFMSLTSPSSPERPELDDLFSSDLSPTVLNLTFGKAGSFGLLKPGQASKPALLVLLSAADEFMPESVDKENLIKKWTAALENGGAIMAPSSGIVAGASHNVKESEAILDLTKRVLGYLHQMIAGVPEAIWVKLSQELERATEHCAGTHQQDL